MTAVLEGTSLENWIQKRVESAHALRMSPWLKEIAVQGTQPLHETQAMASMLASLPLRARVFQDHLRIGLVSDPGYGEAAGFRSSLLVPKTAKAMRRARSLSSVFHRQRLSLHASKGWIHLRLEGDPRFGIEAHFEAHRELVRLFKLQRKPGLLELNVTLKDWARINEDRLWLIREP